MKEMNGGDRFFKKKDDKVTPHLSMPEAWSCSALALGRAF